MSHLPAILPQQVQEMQEQLRRLVGRSRALKASVEPHSRLWKELCGLQMELCVALAAANAASGTLAALRMTGGAEHVQECQADQLELHPVNQELGQDRRMMAANDHTLEED